MTITWMEFKMKLLRKLLRIHTADLHVVGVAEDDRALARIGS